MKRTTREFKMPLTPITKETFERQGWKYVEAEEGMSGMSMMGGDFDEFQLDYYYKLPLPKIREDEFAPYLASNYISETPLLREMGIPSGQFIVSIEDMDGLGTCRYEEEIEVLYRALTGFDIYDNIQIEHQDPSTAIFKVVPS
jgi:hypothetical protein